MNVYLSGLIGSGKTTLGRRLAARLGRPFLDLDRELDGDLGRSFHELVREQGWLAFREREYEIVKRFAAVKNTELEAYQKVISSWEREHLLLNV